MNPQVVHKDVSKPARGCQNKRECVSECERVMAGVCVSATARKKKLTKTAKNMTIYHQET